MPDSLRHAILGAGGVGGLIAANLARSGSPVTLVVRRETIEGYPRQLRLESPFGSVEVEVATAVEVPPVDVLWLTTKATELESALTALKNPEKVGAIVPLLNGIDHIALLRSRYGAARVIPATIAVESERTAPGHIVHRSRFARLSVAASGQKLLAATLDALQKIGFDCRFVADEATLMWGKLVMLGPLALSTTAADRDVGGVQSDSDWRARLEASVREACAVALAEQASLDADAVVATVFKMPGQMRSSMQKDVEQGKVPELDAIAGPILRGAQRHGIQVPSTRFLVTRVEQRMTALSAGNMTA